jgi:hypothetical protein
MGLPKLQNAIESRPAFQRTLRLKLRANVRFKGKGYLNAFGDYSEIFNELKIKEKGK